MFGVGGCDMSVASTTSNLTNVLYMDNIGIVASWTGTTPIGAIFIDASNDGSNWVTLDFGTGISVSGNTGSHVININQFPYNQIRARYVKTSGTGTLTLTLTVKQMGA